MAHKQSRRFTEAQKLVDKNKTYDLNEAIQILKDLPHTKFDETLEFSTKLNVDPKQSDQMVRSSVVLPHGTGKKVKVLVFCEADKEAKAKEAGADYVGSDELADKIIKEGWLDFDCCVATPAMMRIVGKLGKVLGPRGLMPSPKTGTVTDNVSHAVSEAKRGKIDFRMDKLGCISVGLGKISFSKDALVENVKKFLEALNAAKASSVKGELFTKYYLSTTMSPSLRIAL